MKTLLHLAAGILLMGSTTLTAEDIDVRRHIEVKGTAQLFAEVDRAIWRIKVRAEANALEEASNLLTTSIVNLRNELDAQEVGKDSLRLSGISSGRVYTEQRIGPRVFKGFYAERQAIIEIPNLAERQKLEKILLADDRIEILGIDLKSTQHEELRKRSLISAVAAAKAKAAFLAEEAGTNLGVVLSITEGGNYNRPSESNLSNLIENPLFDLAGRPEFEKLDYSATVTVKFELR